MVKYGEAQVLSCPPGLSLLRWLDNLPYRLIVLPSNRLDIDKYELHIRRQDNLPSEDPAPPRFLIEQYKLSILGDGGETKVWKVENKNSQGQPTELQGFVVKDYASPHGFGTQNEGRGFDLDVLERLESVFIKLRRQYGNAIPEVWFLINPLYHNRFVMVQERIEVAEPECIFDYRPEDFTTNKKLRNELKKFVHNLKKHVPKDAASPGMISTWPDLGRGNVVLSKSKNTIYFVDSGVNSSRIESAYIFIGMMDLLSGTTIQEWLADEFYKDLIPKINEQNWIVGIDDLYQFLRNEAGVFYQDHQSTSPYY